MGLLYVRYRNVLAHLLRSVADPVVAGNSLASLLHHGRRLERDRQRVRRFGEIVGFVEKSGIPDSGAEIAQFERTNGQLGGQLVQFGRAKEENLEFERRQRNDHLYLCQVRFSGNFRAL